MIEKSTNRKIVCKTRDKITEKELVSEVRRFGFCHHPALVEFIGFSAQRRKYNFYFVEEEQGSLQDFIQIQKGNPDPLWDDTHKLIIAYGIARGMKYLHSNNIIFGKLKLDNILLDSNLYPHIANFGYSFDIKAKRYGAIVEIQILFMPPELLSDFEKYSKTKGIDVFAYSMILYKLWTDKEPYDTCVNYIGFFENIMHNKRPEFPPGDYLNDKWKQLICNCWDQDPECRPTFDEICERIESPDFLTEKIDKKLFDLYKETLDKA